MKSIAGGFLLAVASSTVLWLTMPRVQRRMHGDPAYRVKAWTVVYILLLLAMGTAVVLGYAYYDRTTRLAREDGPVEWTTFWLSAFAAAGFAGDLWRNRRARLPGLSLLLFLVSLALAGEEISWGQRVLGFEPPPIVSQYNVQKELTLHNIDFGTVRLQGWLQAFLPMLLLIVLLMLQWIAPEAFRRYAGLRIGSHVAVLSALFLLYFLISSFPFPTEEITADVPLEDVALEVLRRHSSPFSELSEGLFAALLLVAAVGLYCQPAQVAGRASGRARG